ncbi:epsin-2-like [Argiope bruennichi]|uniref:Epsin-1 like protein n=1 Tax=Argiope bruennichi TaxID=94029 RepID=A0A8T0FX07_ARGBR|nr:epsin-2-like [Argiope bruennichi]KAF8795611.1 Epsin-1 like protein [Argiope bruennichi]
MLNVQGLRRNVKNVVKNYSDAQVKVREATSNDPWGPSGTLMGEIADLTYNVVAFTEVMQVIWKRLNDHGKNWKHVYKALVLLDYLIKTGSEKVAHQCRENLFAIETLRDFQHTEEGKDQGVNVREKAKQLVALLKDEERLRQERARALKARERFARSTSSSRHFGSSEFSPSSCDEDMPSPSPFAILSDLEQARPQTAGEEELQLQLALAMSKEEAEQAERLRRNDDLRLQMALTRSEEEAKCPSTSSSTPQLASAVEDLLGIDLQPQQQFQPNPWGSSDGNSSNVWNHSLPEQNINLVQNDPWSPASDGNFLSPDEYNRPFEQTSMRKSASAEACAAPSLDAFLGQQSSLISLDAPRSRNTGNPFHAVKPVPLTINEMRAQTNPNVTSQNPFL